MGSQWGLSRRTHKHLTKLSFLSLVNTANGDITCELVPIRTKCGLF